MTDVNILQDDVSKNVTIVVTTSTVFTLTQRIGMWGEAMFGSNKTLGAGLSHSYSNEGKNILLDDISLNVVEI